MPNVRQIMASDPEVVDPDTRVDEVARQMADLSIGAMPVVSEGRLYGIVTDRDIVLRVLAEDKTPSQVHAGDIVTADVVTIGPDADSAEAAALMAQHQIRRLAVVEGDQLVGMVSLGDISVEAETGEASVALRAISSPSEPER